MKNYYEILGLSMTATEHEVKRVYRRLAITYHPDKNPSPEAEVFFKEVNEAYEILGDQTRRAYYDQLLTGNSTSTLTPEPAPAWHRDPAYRKRRQAGYKPPPRGPSERMLFMQQLLVYLKLLPAISFLWCILLVVDYTLPNHISEEKVVTNRAIANIRLKASQDLLLTDKGHHFPASYYELGYFPHQSNLKIYSSFLFSVLVKVQNSEGTYELNSLVSIYRLFVFAPCALLVLSLIGLIFTRDIEFRFNLSVVLFLVFLLNMVFFFVSRV